LPEPLKSCRSRRAGAIRWPGAGDLARGVLALPVREPALAPVPLYDEPCMLAVPENHLLAAPRQVQIGELGDDTRLLEDGHCLHGQALAVCARSRPHEPQDFRATSLAALRQMVAAGAGVTPLPALACRGAYAGATGMRLLALVMPTPTRRIGAARCTGTGRASAIAACCELLARHGGLVRAA
jgi:LysR family hydrogen peroxide-inducible transcriptional activator